MGQASLPLWNKAASYALVVEETISWSTEEKIPMAPLSEGEGLLGDGAFARFFSLVLR